MIHVPMLERKMYGRLLEWKSRKHKCLVVRGQRQVGKTFIIDAFARAEYEHYLYLNFNDSPELKTIFEGDISAEALVNKLSLYFGADSVVEGSTLVFLDEIQECGSAYSSLKQFTLYGKIDVIASGSLLGLSSAPDDDRLIPLGYEESMLMRPLDFEEFLWSRKVPGSSIEEVRRCIRERVPMEPALYERMTRLFREYMVVGGMPEAVQSYAESGDLRQPDAVIEGILSTCMRDINRCNRGMDRIKTMDCFESIPHQLSESNRKFMFSRISNDGSRASSDRYRENLLWIREAGYGNFCFALTQPTLPLAGQVKRDSFKIYMSDTGMLLHMYGDKAKAAAFEGDLSYNMGAVAENIVADGLVKCGYEPMYYRKDKGEGRMELDFVEEFWDGVAAIEVKSGRSRIAPSISKVSDFYYIARRIVLEHGNIRVDEHGIEHYPLFASAFVDEMDRRPRTDGAVVPSGNRRCSRSPPPPSRSSALDRPSPTAFFPRPAAS